MPDALIEGLEAHLHDLEEGITEMEKLITRKGNAVARAGNAIKLLWAWELFKQAFPRDPTRAELSYITGLSEKTVDSILSSGSFKFSIKSVTKTAIHRDYVQVPGDKGFPILVKRRPGRRPPVSSKERGRPSVMYGEAHGGVPGAVALLNAIFSRAAERLRDNPEFQGNLRILAQADEDERRLELASIIGNAMSEPYLPQVMAATAHQLIRIYALPSSGRVYSYLHEMHSVMSRRVSEMVKAHLKIEEVEKVVAEQEKGATWIKDIGSFSELAGRRRCHVVASVFQNWLNAYGLLKEDIRKHVEKMLWQAREEKHLLSELVGKIFQLVDEQVRNIIASSLDSLGGPG